MAQDPASLINRGWLRALFDPTTGSETAQTQPVVQCVQMKELTSADGSSERFRVVFSDMDNYIQTMLATQANPYIKQGRLRKGNIVRLTSFNSNVVKGKKILIVLDLDVLDELGEHEKLGNPQPMEAQPEQEAAKPQPIASNGFYGQKPAPAAAPQQTRLASRPSAPAHSSHGHVYPIESLSPYQHRWTIKARVTSKSDIRTWHNKNGEGKLFSVNLMDESGEIKATGFQDQCDAFYDLFTEGTVYYISSPCRVTLAKKQFTNLPNDYELAFERDTVIEKAEEQSDVPKVRFNFTSLGNLQNVEANAVVDTIGILKEIQEVNQIISKTTSKPYEKRELTLVDNTNFSVRVTIWGKTATSFDTPLESVVAFKGAKVSDFGGRSLSLLSSGTLSVDPDIDEAHSLKGWYDAQGRNDTFSTHAAMGAMGGGGAAARNEPPKTILQIKEDNLGMTEQQDFFNTRATISYIKQDTFAYPACMSDRCNRKVVEHEPGAWRCESCEKTHPEPEYRYVLTLNVVDHTGQMYLNCFDEVGRAVIGMSANDLTKLKNEEQDAEVFSRSTYQTFNFRCKAKMDTYQDQQRVRYQAVSATAVDHVSECARLQKVIDLYD